MANSFRQKRSLHTYVMKALNKIRRPSTPQEITDLLNRDLQQGEEVFSVAEVGTELQAMQGNAVLGLFWLRSRPRR